MIHLRIGALLLLSPLAAQAGRPFVTDDAVLTAAQSCQIESWAQHADALTEFWALPACNPGGNFEITAGLARFEPEVADAEHRALIQGKTLFKPVSAGSFGWGIAAGGLVAVGDSANDERLTQLYAYLPLTFASADERTLLHVNLGTLRDRVLDISRTTWGLAVGHALNDDWSVFGEAYGDDGDDPSVQAGLTRSLAGGRYHLDLTAGRALGNAPDSAFVSIGLNVYFDALLAPASERQP